MAEWYDTLSPSYDQLYGDEQTLKHLKVMEFLRERRYRTLVDIGCGTGGFLERAQALYEHGVGIDVSRRMLESAKLRRSAKTDLVQAVSSHLPIKDGTVDCTVSISTAKADSSLPDLIHDIRRIGTPNSYLAITVFQQQMQEEPRLMTSTNHSLRISERETLYLLRLNRALG